MWWYIYFLLNPPQGRLSSENRVGLKNKKIWTLSKIRELSIQSDNSLDNVHLTWLDSFDILKQSEQSLTVLKVYNSLDQCGTNIIFLDEWISEYIRYHRYWTNEYPNIFGMIKISGMNIQIKSPMKKSLNIFANEYICPKYSNVFKYQIIFQTLFWTIFAIFICCVFCTHIEPFWTNNKKKINNFWETMKIQIYLLS